MKNLTYICWLIALCPITMTHAQSTQQITLHVATAGTLSSIITPSQRPNITNLKLTGKLNGTDIRMIREMAGADIYGNPIQDAALETLDLSEANIVEGGEATVYSATPQSTTPRTTPQSTPTKSPVY